MHLPKTDDSRFLIVTVLVLSGLQHLLREGYAEGTIIEIYFWFRQKETAFLLYEATFSTTGRWHEGHRSPFGVSMIHALSDFPTPKFHRSEIVHRTAPYALLWTEGVPDRGYRYRERSGTSRGSPPSAV